MQYYMRNLNKVTRDDHNEDAPEIFKNMLANSKSHSMTKLQIPAYLNENLNQTEEVTSFQPNTTTNRTKINYPRPYHRQSSYNERSYQERNYQDTNYQDSNYQDAYREGTNNYILVRESLADLENSIRKQHGPSGISKEKRKEAFQHNKSRSEPLLHTPDIKYILEQQKRQWNAEREDDMMMDDEGDYQPNQHTQSMNNIHSLSNMSLPSYGSTNDLLETTRRSRSGSMIEAVTHTNHRPSPLFRSNSTSQIKHQYDMMANQAQKEEPNQQIKIVQYKPSARGQGKLEKMIRSAHQAHEQMEPPGYPTFPAQLQQQHMKKLVKQEKTPNRRTKKHPYDQMTHVFTLKK